MSDTPETDAEVNECKLTPTYNMVWAEFARKLERERDELRKALSLAGKRCDEVHHPKEMQHGYATDCPVEAFIQKVLQ